MNNKTIYILSCTLALFLLNGCDNSYYSNQHKNDTVIAKVDGTKIYQSQLTVLKKRIKQQNQGLTTNALESKMIESLIRMRALANHAEKNMDDEELMLLNAKTNAYREELLTKEYINNNIETKPITQQMVKEYYENNKDKFSQGTNYNYLKLSAEKKELDEKSTQQVRQAYNNAKTNKDWKSIVNNLNNKGINAQLLKITKNEKQLNAALKQQLKKLKEGETSDIYFAEQISIYKLLTKEPEMIKPLPSVSHQIRQMLAPNQLKKAIEQHTKEITNKAKVNIIKD